MLIRRGTTHYKKYANAVDSLLQGADIIRIPPISITNFEDEGLSVKVWSTAAHTEASVEVAIAEFSDGIELFHDVCNEWQRLGELATSERPPFYYQYDYGGGSVRLGSADYFGNIKLNLPS